LALCAVGIQVVRAQWVKAQRREDALTFEKIVGYDAASTLALRVVLRTGYIFGIADTVSKVKSHLAL
jgi:hypothetical protein